MSKLSKKEILEALKDPEIQQELSKEKGLEALLKPLELTDDDTLESLARKQNEQLQKVVKYFKDREDSVKADAVEEATRGQKEDERRRIEKFEKDNPGMKNAEVINIMQPLYNNGMSLEDSYAKACKALDLNPETGEAPKEEDAKSDKDKKSTKEPEKKVSSARSSLQVPEDDDSSDDSDKRDEDKPQDLKSIISANINAYDAKHGKDDE